MRSLLALLIGIALGAGAVWYYQQQKDESQIRRTGSQVEHSVRSAGAALEQKLRSFNLEGDDIKEELARTGRVIRKKSEQAGQAISDATADSRITAAIKAKLLRDSDLSAWDISVSTTDGTVTLSGAVSSAEQVGKAMLLAMETDGVRQVISALQVKTNRES